ncbi:uncharacterized protein Dwil_GK10153 [Drosophila willistoni]|uniref:SKP1 component POZ domain-containing protein n=1 Tax=Drosophila willistoni TaxID=7260 RepID=B4ND35_DROWI|nr:S-phase kinase-associated protein 1-like [Drosophila willistoni]EDW82744.2 uncharacterized protein Dwil_GK10153 [Drosophila willistoni]
MPMIKLQSSDMEIFEVDIEVAKCSGTIKTMLESSAVEEDENAVVPVLNVDSTILRKVLTWASHHRYDPQPTEEDESIERRREMIRPWDAHFINVDQGTLFQLILAANYLDMKGLLLLTCKATANIIKGKTPEEICKAFNIQKDPPAAEEK